MSEVEEHTSDDAALAARASSRLGQTLRGKYRLESVLGVGGMAAVYRATHRNQAEFAIKMLHPEISLHESIRSRFLKEGYAANSVKHPGVVRVVDDDTTEEGVAFLVMDLLDGMSVEDLWAQSGRRLAPGVAFAIGAQVLDVLAAAHERGVVHRDIKPANLFVTRDGTVKVLDFGIARARSAAGGTSSMGTAAGVLLGTPAFMAPEQALGDTPSIDGQAGLGAVGATLFTLLTGQTVHLGDNTSLLLIHAATRPARSVEEVPTAPPLAPELVAWLARALAFDKAGRWPDAATMRAQLVAAYQPSSGELPARDTLGELLAEAAGKTPPLSGTAPAPGPSPVVPSSRGERAATPVSSASGSSARSGTSTALPLSRSIASETDSYEQRVRGGGGSKAVVFGGGLAVVAALALAAVFALRPRPAAESTERAAGAIVNVPPVAVAPVLATDATGSTATTTAPALSASALAMTAPAARPGSASPRHHEHAAVAVGASPATAATPSPAAAPPPPPAAALAAPAATARPGCNPNFTLDAEGHQHFKPECF